MPARETDKTSKPAVRKPATPTAAAGTVAGTLPVAMTGKASPAKAAVGDKPVFAYIASLPQPQRGIAERVDALAAETLPGLQRSVKWGMSYYGVGDGWCFCCGGFAGHVKLMFVNGAALEPVPPVTPVGMGKSTRGVELESVDDLDERQIAAWMTQVAAGAGSYEPPDRSVIGLGDYLPGLLDIDRQSMPPLADVQRHLGNGAGVDVPVPVPHDCVDSLLGAYWRRPHAYLDAGVRSAIVRV
ncbi:MAG: DUF1801 domain-containing protein [Ardenticatenales bacterium]